MSKPATSAPRKLGSAERDFIALGIIFAAIILCVGNGGAVLRGIGQALAGFGFGPDKLAINALLLNVALIIFALRRYRQLYREIGERRKAEDQARVLSETDPLTGCLNRRSVAPATDHLIDRARARGEAVAFMMIDVDNFKRINDYHGHGAGDRVLQECAAHITAQLPPEGLLARLGGDEFACIVPFPPARTDSMDRLAARIVAAVTEPVIINGTSVEISVSVGLAHSQQEHGDQDHVREKSPTDADHAVDAQTLLHMADIAMYQAKKRGRNRYFWFEQPMESELRFRNELEAGIRAGMTRAEFVPYYEQQIDLGTGTLIGFEMLARWNSPKLGMVSPEIFIPVAEEIGLIGELSERLIAEALQDAKGWDPTLSLSVNISPLQLRDPWFAQKLLKLLVEANFPPSRLEIEITETCLHENIAIVRTLIASLKNQGIRVSLDDFGTGYSSLAQLRNLPFDRIKIDRSFVMNMHENPDSATIVQAIASLGKGLGLPVTAEGIECAEVLSKLKEYGQIKGQGYFYGHPESASVTHERLTLLDRIAPVGPPNLECGEGEATDVWITPRAVEG